MGDYAVWAFLELGDFATLPFLTLYCECGLRADAGWRKGLRAGGLRARPEYISSAGIRLHARAAAH